MTENEYPESSEPPWWHSMPQNPPVDSMWVEAARLAEALRQWAEDSGALDTASTWLTGAARALVQPPEPLEESQIPGTPDQAPSAHRCRDCPVCVALDALEVNQPEAAQVARGVITQATRMVAGLLQAFEPDTDADA